jgi:hypothetical protein
MFLNASIPRFEALLRKEYLYNLREHSGEFVRCCVFGLASLQGRAITFHCLLENGAQIARLPISAFVHRRDAPPWPLDWLEVWDCFSYEVAVTEFDFLQHMQCSVYLKNRQWCSGTYMFTVDWCGTRDSEDAGDLGHKNAHVIRLDNGLFCAQPNNRVRWLDPAMVTAPFEQRPDFRTNTHSWKVEQGSKWRTEDSDRMFYEVEQVGTPPAAPATPCDAEFEASGVAPTHVNGAVPATPGETD